MSKTSIAKRYAKALFGVSDLETAQETLDQLQIISEVCETGDIKNLLKSPVVPNTLKNEVFKAIFQVRPIAKDLQAFIEELLNNGRIVYLADVMKAYEELINDKKSILDATFIFANIPSQELISEIKMKLAQSFKKNINEKIAIDPKIIGGFIIEMGNKKIDLSLQTEVQTI